MTTYTPSTIGLATKDADHSPAVPAQAATLTVGGVMVATRRVLIAFAVLTMLAANQLLVVASFTDRLFAWTISVRPTSAFLGAAYAAGFVLAVLALRRTSWREVRVAFVTVTVFTVLTLIPTLIHLHIFHLSSGETGARLAAWVWLAIYVVVPIACLVVMTRQQRQPSVDETARRPMPSWLTWLLVVQGSILFGVGAVMFFGGAKVHHLPEGAMGFWPWRLTPLSAQMIGAWLLALAVAAALAIWERDLNRMAVPAATYAAFGVFQLLVAAGFWAEVRPDYQWGWAYLGMLASIALTGGYGWWAATSRAASSRRRASATRLDRVSLTGLGLGEVALSGDLVPAGLDPLGVQRAHPVGGCLHRPLGVGQLELGLPVGRLGGGQLLLGPPQVGPGEARPARRSVLVTRVRRSVVTSSTTRRPATATAPGGQLVLDERLLSSAGSSGCARRSQLGRPELRHPGPPDRSRCARAVGPDVRCGWSAHRPGRPERPAGWPRPPTARSAVSRTPASSAWARARSIRSAISRRRCSARLRKSG